MTRPLTLEDQLAIPFASDPNLSPDGRTVAFVRTLADRDADEDRSTIWTVSVAGGEPRELTTGGHDAAPRWSPDGTKLAFVSKRGDGPAQLYVLPTNGGEARALTDLPLGAGPAVWSPDGSTIAFAAPVDLAGPADDPKKRSAEPLVVERLDYKVDGAGLLGTLRKHVFVVPVDGGTPHQVTAGDFFASDPVWSPDGTRLAFSASLAEDRDLSPASVVYMIPSTGGAPRALTPAHWQPRV